MREELLKIFGLKANISNDEIIALVKKLKDNTDENAKALTTITDERDELKAMLDKFKKSDSLQKSQIDGLTRELDDNKAELKKAGVKPGLSKDKLQAIAEQTFKDHPQAEEVYVTTDGNAFLDISLARAHKQAEKLELKTFKHK